MFAALDPAKNKLHVMKSAEFLEFCRYLCSLYPHRTRISIACDTFSPNLTTKKCRPVRAWVASNNVEIVYTPTSSRACATSPSPEPTTPSTEWRNRHADAQGLRTVVSSLWNFIR